MDGFSHNAGRLNPAVVEDDRTPRTLEKVVVALMLVASNAMLFLLVDEWNARSSSASLRMLDPHTAWDAAIPFVPGYIYPYLAYYVWLLAPIPILRSRSQFYHAVYAFGATQLIAVVIFLAFPSQMSRPLVLGTSLSERLVRLIYEIDRGYNILPSLHVAHSMLVAMLFAAHKPKLFPPIALGSALICASTVLVKQHYLLDIPAGVVVALVSYYGAMAFMVSSRQSA